MTNQTPIISIRNLVTELGRNIVHEHLDLDIYQGEIFGIVGGSGAGKSVLMNTILGLITPKEGEIKLINVEPIGGTYNASIYHQQIYLEGEWRDSPELNYTKNGEEHQGCPTLILGDPTRPVPSNVTVNEAKGRRFISDDIEICRYLAKTYGVGEPH